LLAKPHKAAKEEGHERRMLEAVFVTEGENTLEGVKAQEGNGCEQTGNTGCPQSGFWRGLRP
jgi:hypothetical protein